MELSSNAEFCFVDRSQPYLIGSNYTFFGRSVNVFVTVLRFQCNGRYRSISAIIDVTPQEILRILRMQKLPTPLRILINQYGFITVPLVPLVVLAVILGRNGWSFVNVVILTLAVAAIFLWWWTQHARHSANVPASTPSLLNEIGQSGKYAMLAFESEFCISSTTVGKRLNELEAAFPNKFQIYELSILSDPGKELFKRYDGRVTPTFVLLHPDGQVMMDWPLVLPVERVSYALKQQDAQK